MKNNKFSFTIVANCDSWCVEDLVNISEDEALEIAYTIDNQRGINEVSCDDYYGENLYVEGDKDTNIVRVEVETQTIDEKNITIYDDTGFNKQIYRFEYDNVVRMFVDYLGNQSKRDIEELEYDNLELSFIPDEAFTTLHLNVNLSIKYWSVYVGINYQVLNREADEIFKLTTNKAIKD